MSVPVVNKNQKPPQESDSSFLALAIEALLEIGASFVVDGKLFFLEPETDEGGEE